MKIYNVNMEHSTEHLGEDKARKQGIEKIKQGIETLFLV